MLGTYDIDKNGDTPLTDDSSYRIRGGKLVFDQVLKGGAAVSGVAEARDFRASAEPCPPGGQECTPPARPLTTQSRIRGMLVVRPVL